MTSTWYSKGRFDQYVKLQQKMEANLPNLHLDQKSTNEKREIIEKYHNQTSAQVEWWQKHFPHICTLFAVAIETRIFYDHFAPGSQDVEYWLDRLPKETFKPTLYHVKVRPYFPSSAKYEWYKNLTFDGSVDIDFEVLKRVTEIKLNAHRMVIEAANIRLIQRPTNVSYQIESIEKDFTNGWATTYFPPTPPMSSYLFAAAVGHFASLETVSKTGVLVRAWAWTGMERYAEFGLKTVAGTVDFMATYFDYPFPMPKLDSYKIALRHSEICECLKSKENHFVLRYVSVDEWNAGQALGTRIN
ncbi:unnamed protein product [Anisakis simplex]|uniref:Amino_oxidase domain-containing protein n=1 Tax=Anisakis simplex TaxID=6269 RepID=A0A0M3KCE1_ANISI|nr:unnamed protein product [Anisakis simplex]